MNKTDIIKIVTEYNSYSKVLSPIIKRYFEETRNDWQHYNGWEFCGNGEFIAIRYSYEDFVSNTETCTEIDCVILSLDELLEYKNKSL